MPAPPIVYAVFSPLKWNKWKGENSEHGHHERMGVERAGPRKNAGI